MIHYKFIKMKSLVFVHENNENKMYWHADALQRNRLTYIP